MNLNSLLKAKPYKMIDIGANLAGNHFSKDFDKVVSNAFLANVEKIIITGTSMNASKRADSLVYAHNNKYNSSGEPHCKLYSTAGIHPHQASTFRGQETIDSLKNLLDNDSVVAVGECGLDYDRMFSTKVEQLDCFKAHIEIERHYREVLGKKKPLFLHDRAAHEDFLAILREYRPLGVVHCFTGSREQVERYVELDMYIGVTGWLCDTRRNKELLRALPAIPLNRLLIETDAPFLAPRKEIKRNEPKYLSEVVAKIAAVLNISEEEVAAQTTANANELFGI